MSLRHKNFADYGAELVVSLDTRNEKLRDVQFEMALLHGFALASYVMEDFKAKATKNHDIFDKVGMMLIELLDVLRATLHGQHELSPVTLGTLSRVWA